MLTLPGLTDIQTAAVPQCRRMLALVLAGLGGSRELPAPVSDAATIDRLYSACDSPRTTNELASHRRAVTRDRMIAPHLGAARVSRDDATECSA
jgi:hypothetical protein